MSSARPIALDPAGRDAGVVARVLAHAATDRDRHCADPDWATVPADELLSDAYVRAIAEDAMSDSPVRLAGQRKVSGDTVAVVVADADGTWVSLIQSVFHRLRRRPPRPREPAFVLHNRGASLLPRPRLAEPPRRQASSPCTP